MSVFVIPECFYRESISLSQKIPAHLKDDASTTKKHAGMTGKGRLLEVFPYLSRVIRSVNLILSISRR